MLQSTILIVFYFSTDSAAVRDWFFHGFRKSTEAKKIQQFQTRIWNRLISAQSEKDTVSFNRREWLQQTFIKTSV